jgi:hypothetical protein
MLLQAVRRVLEGQWVAANSLRGNVVNENKAKSRRVQSLLCIALYARHVTPTYLLCCNALHFKHCGVKYRLEQMPKYRHTIRLVPEVVNVAFTPRR